MASPTLPISISEVNSLSDEQFESVFGNVIELCTEAAVEVKKNRPFQDITALCDAFQTYLKEIAVEDKLVILKLHPDLAGRLAARGELTPESAGEQKAAGLDGLTAEDKRVMDESNQRKQRVLYSLLSSIFKMAGIYVGTALSLREQCTCDAGVGDIHSRQFHLAIVGISACLSNERDNNNKIIATLTAVYEVSRYKAKFGFPFIICARENKVQSIIDGLQRRFDNSQEQEITIGINEVKKICKLRILDIVKN